MKFMYLLMRIVCIFALLSLVVTATVTTNVVQVFVNPVLKIVCHDGQGFGNFILLFEKTREPVSDAPHHRHRM